MWEHFTTKPLVDKGVFRRVDSVTTPWPCFVIAVRDEVLESSPEAVKTIIKVINKQLKVFKKTERTKDLEMLFSERYQQQLEDIRTWLSMTKWNRKQRISKKLINTIQNKLVTFNVISERVDTKMLLKKIN